MQLTITISVLVRLSNIVNRLREQRKATSKDFAESLEVCQKTVLRDMKTLNYLYDAYLSKSLIEFDFSDESDPIAYDFSTRTFRLRRELRSLTIAEVVSSLTESGPACKIKTPKFYHYL